MLYGDAKYAVLSGDLQYRLVFSRLDRSSKQKKSKPKDSTLLRTAPNSKSSQKFVKLFRIFLWISAKKSFFRQFWTKFAQILMKIYRNFAEYSRNRWDFLKFSEFLNNSEKFSWILKEFWRNSDVQRFEWFGRPAIRSSFNPAARRGADLLVARGLPQRSGLKDTVPERPYHSNLCTSEFH